MKTLLIYPPFHRLHRIRNRFFPIGLGYLAASLKREDQEVAIYNAENYDEAEKLAGELTHTEALDHFQYYQDALDDPGHYVWQEARRVFQQYKPDVVGITTKSCMVPSATRISQIAKDVNPRTVVIWGGPHPSILPEETMQLQCVDFAARHEGEQTIAQFIRMLQRGGDDWSTIDGLVWRDAGGQIIHNPLRSNTPEIDAVAFPDKSAVLMPDRYEPDDYGVMFTSRGCPWPCTFCDSRGVWTRKVRYRSPENIVAEMEQLYERYGVRFFYFWDDTFTINAKHSLNVFNAMIERFPDQGRQISWRATTRCDCVDDQLAAKMKQSGCSLLTFGIESGSPSMMEILRKGITHEKVAHCERVMTRARILWDAFFMIGFPDDTEQTIDETMQMIRHLRCRSVALSIFTPYPGLELYERARQYGLIEEPVQWRWFSHQSPRNHFVKDIPRERFHEIVADCFREIDEQNFRRCRAERLRYYARHPVKALKRIRERAGL